MATTNKSVEAIVLSVAPEDEDDSCDEEPRELWRQAKVVQYGKKLTSGGPNDGVGGSEEDVNNVSARVQPFIKSHASRRQRAEASRSARRKRSQQQSDVGLFGHHGARHQRGSFSSTEVSTDEEDEVDDESDGNRSRRSGGSVGNSRRRQQPGVASNAKSSSTSGPSYKTKQGSNKFKSRYGNTLRLEDAILTPGFKQIRQTARVLHGAVRFNVSGSPMTESFDLSSSPASPNRYLSPASSNESISKLVQRKQKPQGTPSKRPASSRNNLQKTIAGSKMTSVHQSKDANAIKKKSQDPKLSKRVTNKSEHVPGNFVHKATRDVSHDVGQDKGGSTARNLKKKLQEKTSPGEERDQRSTQIQQENLIGSKYNESPLVNRLKERIGYPLSRSSSMESRSSAASSAVSSNTNKRVTNKSESSSNKAKTTKKKAGSKAKPTIVHSASRGSLQQEFKSFHANLKSQVQKNPTEPIMLGSSKASSGAAMASSTGTQQMTLAQLQQQNNYDMVQAGAQPPDALKLRRRSSSIGRSLNAMATQVARRAKRRHSKEELYTDKDRAAAVALGSRDIKTSLFRQNGGNPAYAGLPEEAGFTVCYTQGEHNLKNGDSKLALKFLDKALAIDANNCNCLIARSKCHLQLGDHSEALKDAEAALRLDPYSYKAIYQKAEALYAKGDFELALVFYCRGAQARKEMDCFRLGVQKAQEAISNVVGRPRSMQQLMNKTASPRVKLNNKASGVPDVQQSSLSDATSNKTNRTQHQGENRPTGSAQAGDRRHLSNTVPRIRKSSTKSANSSASSSSNGCRGVLGKLHNDMEYLENLLSHPGLQPITVPTMIASGLPTVTSNAVISYGAMPSPVSNTTSSLSKNGRHRASGKVDSGVATAHQPMSAGHLMNEKNKNVASQVKEALGYLKARQEFWMQQKPIKNNRTAVASTVG